MSLIKNIFIVLIIAVILFFIINHFFLRTNIIWDDLVNGQTSTSGGVQPSKIVTPETTSTTSKVPLPFLSSNFQSETSLRNFVKSSGQSGLIIPNSKFPTLMTSNIMFSIWFFIDDYTVNLNKNKYICSLIGTQSGDFSPSLILFLTPNNNNFGIAVRTYNTGGSSVLNFYYIENIPIQKWNCIILSIVDRTLDVYLDGKLINSFILEGFYATMPNTNLIVGSNVDYFTGFITRARYENGGVNPQQAYSIYKEGIKSSFAGDFLNKYRLKVGLYEYNDRVGGFTI